MKRAASLFGGIFVSLLSANAFASFHEWRISEIYSNASGSVQFIEFQQPGTFIDDEKFLLNMTLQSGSNTYTFPANLPATTTGTSRFLVATPGYAALAGVPAPDYTTAVNNFFSTSGDTLTFAGFVDSLTFTGAQLPTNGTQSLNRTTWGGATVASQTASPTNFANVTGTVPEPTSMLFALTGLLGMGIRRRIRQ